LSIRAISALAIVLAGCFDEQSIELAVTRDSTTRNLGVRVCADDGTACKPEDGSENVFSGSGLETEVHIVVSDDRDVVLVKLQGTEGAAVCNIVTIQSELLHYEVSVSDSGVSWPCATACELQPTCSF
jgi:hypothetical protein